VRDWKVVPATGAGGFIREPATRGGVGVKPTSTTTAATTTTKPTTVRPTIAVGVFHAICGAVGGRGVGGAG